MPDNVRITSLIQTAQGIQNNLEGEHAITSETRKLQLVAMQLEATALVARAIGELTEMVSTLDDTVKRKSMYSGI